MDLPGWVISQTKAVVEEAKNQIQSSEPTDFYVDMHVQSNPGILRILKGFDELVTGLTAPNPVIAEAAMAIEEFGLDGDEPVFTLEAFSEQLLFSNCNYVLEFLGRCFMELEDNQEALLAMKNLSLQMDADGEPIISYN